MITAVIPAYRAAATIERTIDSLLAQAHVDLRIIVIIDGRHDDTQERLTRYDDRVLVVQKPRNEGASRARNDGLALVATPFMMFVDADDFVEGELIAGLLHAIREDDCDIVFGPMQILHERSGRREARFVPDFSSPEDVFAKWHLEGVFVTPISVMWRTEFVRRIGGWDALLSRNDDGELVMRAILQGARIGISSRGTGVYVKHSRESLNNRTDNMESMLRANEKLLAIDDPAISRDLQTKVCAGHYFNIAWHCYLAGQDVLGDEALRRSRAAGFGVRGPLHYRVAFRLLGLKAVAKLVGSVKSLSG